MKGLASLLSDRVLAKGYSYGWAKKTQQRGCHGRSDGHYDPATRCRLVRPAGYSRALEWDWVRELGKLSKASPRGCFVGCRCLERY